MKTNFKKMALLTLALLTLGGGKYAGRNGDRCHLGV